MVTPSPPNQRKAQTMTTDLATTDDKTTGRSKALQVTGRLRKAVELMIWQGHSRDEAADAAGMVRKSLYNAFRKHHVKAYFRAELGALRESARAKNFHHLETIAAESENDMAKVAAIKTMTMEYWTEEESQRRPAGGHVSSPGMTIVILPPLPAGQLDPIDITPRRDLPVADPATAEIDPIDRS